ncbi:MAG: acetoin utilization protein AcuB [Granulosicoccus sp.]|jgi:acetoin utilization protein AcuB
MKVKSFMTKHVFTVTMDDSVSDVKNLFDEHEFHHLLVVDRGKLSGVLSDRDLLKVLSPEVDSPNATAKDLACLKKPVHQIMTRRPITLHQDASIRDAIDVFNQHIISCLPIINDVGKAVGILTWRDVIRVLASPADPKVDVSK